MPLILEKMKGSRGSSQMEKLPRVVIAHLSTFLAMKDLIRLSMCSRFLTFNLLCSELSLAIWKNKVISFIGDDVDLTGVDLKRSNTFYDECNTYLRYWKNTVFEQVWDEKKIGSNVSLSMNNRRLRTGGGSWNIGFCKNKIVFGSIHCLDIYIESMRQSHLIFIGCGYHVTPYDRCTYASEKNMWSVGHDSRGEGIIGTSNDFSAPKWTKGDFVQVLLDTTNRDQVKMTALVNGVTKSNMWKFNFKAQEDLYFSTCIASNMSIEIVDYKIGQTNIENYLKRKYNSVVNISLIE